MECWEWVWLGREVKVCRDVGVGGEVRVDRRSGWLRSGGGGGGSDWGVGRSGWGGQSVGGGGRSEWVGRSE